MINLKQFASGDIVPVNPPVITYLERYNDGTTVYFIGDSWVNVKESVEEVLKKLEEVK